jgi:hypothetical protein
MDLSSSAQPHGVIYLFIMKCKGELNLLLIYLLPGSPTVFVGRQTTKKYLEMNEKDVEGNGLGLFSSWPMTDNLHGTISESHEHSVGVADLQEGFRNWAPYQINHEL